MNWIRQALERRSLIFKLMMGFASLMLLILGIGAQSVWIQRELNSEVDTLYEQGVVGVARVKDLQIGYAQIGRTLRQVLIATNASGKELALKQLAQVRAPIAQSVKQLQLRITDPVVQKMLGQFDERFAVYLKQVDQALQYVAQGRGEDALTLVASDQFQSAGLAANEILTEVVLAQEMAVAALVQTTKDDSSSRLALTLAMALVGSLLGLLAGTTVASSIRQPMYRIRDAVQRLAQGHLAEVVPHADYPNEVGELASAVQVLQRESQQMETERWVKTHISEIAAKLQQATTFTDMLQLFFSSTGPLINLGHGVFYIFEAEQKRLRLLSSYAFRERKSMDQYFDIGQGLVGQCALEMVPMIFTDPPADYVRIGSSLGEGVPRTLAIRPVQRNQRLLGVLELASFEHTDARQEALLDGLMPILAMNLEILERSVKAQQLLQETQRQAESMEKQAAHLEEQTVELEAQQRSLKETTAHLAVLEERSRLILDSVKDGIVGMDANGIISFSNPAGHAMLGFTAEEFVGHGMHALVHHHYADGAEFPRVECKMYLTAQDGQQRTVDDEVLWRKDGTAVPVEYSTTPVYKDGTIVGSVIVYRDISERKASELAVRASEERLAMALKGGNLGLWDWQANPDVLVTNDIWSEMLGYSRPEMDAMYPDTAARWANMVWPEDMDRAVTNFTKFVNGEIPDYRIEMCMKTKSGEPLWVLAVGGAVTHDENGKVSRMVGIHQDITERKRAELEILLAKQLAEEATKAKSDFLANMSHEIRTPMNAIIGMSHLALQTNLDKKQRNYIEKVHRSGENLLGIINDILDFSKIEAGKMSMETIAFRLEDVMDNLANLVGMKAEDKGLELLFNAAADVPTALQGDPLRLGQILINLGNNAVKFTDKGEIVVGIEKVAEDATGVDLHFWVKDSGIGMTPEQCAKMFQSFSQADASTTRKYGGTGLGLAISKNLVEAMGGRIWVESEPGIGSSFHFNAHFAVQANPQARRMFKAEELLGVRVLVVDDNASAREILSTMAKTFGLEVDVAWDGQQALSMIAQADNKALPYDLVLMDWKMPVMDGVETVRQLQTEQLNRTPTVIMVTAYGREEAMGSAQERGVKLSTVLTKPVTSSTLLEAIGETLGKGIVAETRATEKAGSHTEVMAKLEGAKILLVEDNDMNQELAMELLANAGIEVVLANHGQEALDILAKDHTFDGVLMDCQMPVMDGYTATRAIRKNPQFKDLPIIAMTANAMAGDKEKVLEAGMWDHIAKPLNVGEMFATIAKWIKPKAVVATQSVAAHAIDTGATGQNDVRTAFPELEQTERVKTALERLTVLLKDSDADAGDAVDELLDLAQGTQLAFKLKRVAAAVADFDFDAALAALQYGDI